MDNGLSGKVAIVTGGSKGIGRSISESLAFEGVRVIVVARGNDAITDTCKAIERIGGEATGIEADVTSLAEAENVVQRTLDKYSQLDFLVNNAGGAPRFGSFQECREGDWLDAFKLNVMGCVNFAKASEAALLKSSQARIVTISSISGLQPGYFNPHYSISKAATINLSKHLSNIYSDKGICCNVVCAGPVHSDSWDKNVASIAARKGITFETAFKELEAQEISKVPMGIIGEPEDISSLVSFLLSKKAKWITGSCFQVNGGKYAGMS